jgi:galactitol-specific phosphotransferase system IIC component
MKRRDLGWFGFATRLFAVGLALGLLLVVVAPVDFVRWLGTAATIGSVLGLALALAGRRLEASALAGNRWSSPRH